MPNIAAALRALTGCRLVGPGRLTMLAAALAATLFGAVAAAAAPTELVYRVSHSLVGDLGSYTCTVEPLGNGETQIRSRQHLDVRMLGVPVYRMDAANTELWRGDRLISFHAVTQKPGGRVEIEGEARDGRFVITSPQGRMTAALGVHPAEPCAGNFLQSTTILHPDTGGVEPVRVSGGTPTTITVAGVAVPVRKYVLDGSARYTVWLDSRNLPVMFAVEDGSGRATFTLAKCISCDPAISRLGFE